MANIGLAGCIPQNLASLRRARLQNTIPDATQLEDVLINAAAQHTK